jgi:hypothetical protein
MFGCKSLAGDRPSSPASPLIKILGVQVSCGLLAPPLTRST